MIEERKRYEYLIFFILIHTFKYSARILNIGDSKKMVTELTVKDLMPYDKLIITDITIFPIFAQDILFKMTKNIKVRP